MSTQHPDPEKPTPPWYFLFLDLPFGAAVGYLSLAVPFWMERRGFDLATIAAVTAGANLAHAFKLAWIPLLDLAAKRRIWYLATAATTAIIFVVLALMPDPLANLPLFTVLMTLLQASATTGHAANNTLMATTTRFSDKGKVGGFAMASNLGATYVLGAAALLIADHASARAAGFFLAVVVLGSSTLAIRIVEPRQVSEALDKAGSAFVAGLRHLGSMFRDLWSAIRSREGFTGLLICLAPVGCAAMSNLFTGISKEYGASAEIVSAANGLGGGIAGAVGALLGGVLADKMSRRMAYAASGGITAICALAMAAAPMTPLTYAWGTFTYLFAGGIAFATWAGMVLELVGPSAAAATKYALFNATANLAISYVTFLVGWYPSYKGEPLFIGISLGSLPDLGVNIRLPTLSLPGARGALVTDAILTFFGIAFLLLMIYVVRRQRVRAAGEAIPALPDAS